MITVGIRTSMSMYRRSIASLLRASEMILTGVLLTLVPSAYGETFTPKSPLALQEIFFSEANSDALPKEVRLEGLGESTSNLLRMIKLFEASRDTNKYARNGEAGGWIRFDSEKMAEALIKPIKGGKDKELAKIAVAVANELQKTNSNLAPLYKKKKTQDLSEDENKKRLELEEMRRTLCIFFLNETNKHLSRGQVHDLVAKSGFSLQKDITAYLSWNPGTRETGRASYAFPEENITVVGAMHTHPEDSDRLPSAPDIIGAGEGVFGKVSRYPNYIGDFVFHEGTGRMSWRIPSQYLVNHMRRRKEFGEPSSGRIAFCRAFNWSTNAPASRKEWSTANWRPAYLSGDLACSAWASQGWGFALYETERGGNVFRRASLDVDSPTRIAVSILHRPIAEVSLEVREQAVDFMNRFLARVAYVEGLVNSGEMVSKLSPQRGWEVISQLWQRYLDLPVPTKFTAESFQRLFLSIIDSQSELNENTPETFTLCKKGDFPTEDRSAYCMRLMHAFWENAVLDGFVATFEFGNFVLKRDVETRIFQTELISKEENLQHSLFSPRTGQFTDRF